MPARLLLTAPALCLALLAGCQQSTPVSPGTPPNPPAITGADRDAHGCVGSAGYQWCEREASCVRPWELASRQAIANSAQAVSQYCALPAR